MAATKIDERRKLNSALNDIFLDKMNKISVLLLFFS